MDAPKFQIAMFKADCPLCPKVFESSDGYGAAREMRDAHVEADHG
jgi:hypothetical protein